MDLQNRSVKIIMIREILYRGKRIDNSEWIEGTYWQSNESIIDKQGYSIKITPKTVGQYTGLKDKNGKKIFEGDILRFTRGGNEYIGKVVYEQRICGLDLWYNEVVGAYGEKATFRISLTEPTKLEVIGNIYDTPELLEVE